MLVGIVSLCVVLGIVICICVYLLGNSVLVGLVIENCVSSVLEVGLIDCVEFVSMVLNVMLGCLGMVSVICMFVWIVVVLFCGMWMYRCRCCVFDMVKSLVLLLLFVLISVLILVLWVVMMLLNGVVSCLNDLSVLSCCRLVVFVVMVVCFVLRLLCFLLVFCCDMEFCVSILV